MARKIRLQKKTASQLAVDALYAEAGKRASASVCCPVAQLKSFVELCLSQSCGKCTPCRIGLARAAGILSDILSGTAEQEDFTVLKDLAQTILQSADCAIGFEAARQILSVTEASEKDFLSHMTKGECTVTFDAVPCSAACPAHVDIPAYIALTKEGRYKDAIRMIRYDNPFPAACALICEHPCEGGCRRSLVDAPVNIREIKRVAVDHAGNVPVPECREKTGKKIAIVGGGPSGLTAAYYLQLMGHETTVFEQRAKLGGMMRYGIPRYRLPESYLNKDIDAILSTGVKTYLNTSVDEEKFAEILREYDAVYLPIGAQGANLSVEGADADGVYSAVSLLRSMGDKKAPSFKGKRVVVIGGGNVAMDCTRTAKRLGAKSVKCVYRRRIEDMTAQPDEVQGAIAEGCEVIPMLSPERIVKDENGKVTAFVGKPQIPGPVEHGRPKPVDADKDPVVILCDIVVIAIGQQIDSDAFVKQGVPAKRGRFSAEESCLCCEIGGTPVFAGGDALTGPSTVVRAVEAGKVAAAAIDDRLGFDNVLERTVEVPAAKAGSAPARGRIDAGERAAEERNGDFDIMACPLTAEEAAAECSRCLRCDHYGMGAFRNGRTEEW